MRRLLLVLLRVHNAILLNLRLMVGVHRRHELESGSWGMASEALDDVCYDALAVAHGLRSMLKAAECW